MSVKVEETVPVPGQELLPLQVFSERLVQAWVNYQERLQQGAVIGEKLLREHIATLEFRIAELEGRDDES